MLPNEYYSYGSFDRPFGHESQGRMTHGSELDEKMKTVRLKIGFKDARCQGYEDLSAILGY